MVTTVFMDINKGQDKEVKSIPLDMSCQKGDYVDFGKYDQFSDYDIYIVKNIIHLPNEGKKIVEIKQTTKD